MSRGRRRDHAGVAPAIGELQVSMIGPAPSCEPIADEAMARRAESPS
jgi:hypothetical protein